MFFFALRRAQFIVEALTHRFDDVRGKAPLGHQDAVGGVVPPARNLPEHARFDREQQHRNFAKLRRYIDHHEESELTNWCGTH